MNKYQRTTRNAVILKGLVKELRSLLPHKPLTLPESLTHAERQANYALQLAGQTQPDVNLGWILDLPKVEVQLAPRYKMDGLAGFTTFSHGRYFVMVNKNDSATERRFTLAHEFKHLLDYTGALVIHRQLGYGDPARQAEQIEQICDHFAACLLMPRMWLKRAWASGFQNVPAMAELFNVSDEAMASRLRFLGFIDDDPKPLQLYFRRDPTLLTATA